jgi:hypothetical protein
MYSGASPARRINMRWQLAGPWPVGAAVIPAGSLISDDDDPSAIPTAMVPMPPPTSATALDDSAAMVMAMAYEERDTINGWHQLHFAPGIDREAIFAQARHKKRWPNGEPTQAERPLKGASLSLPEEEEPPSPPVPRPSTSSKRKSSERS